MNWHVCSTAQRWRAEQVALAQSLMKPELDESRERFLRDLGESDAAFEGRGTYFGGARPAASLRLGKESLRLRGETILSAWRRVLDSPGAIRRVRLRRTAAEDAARRVMGEKEAIASVLRPKPDSAGRDTGAVMLAGLTKLDDVAGALIALLDVELRLPTPNADDGWLARTLQEQGRRLVELGLAFAGGFALASLEGVRSWLAGLF